MLLSFLICTASIAVIPIVHGRTLKQDRANEACETKKCDRQAERILNSMNPNVNPCDDFYSYACGSWRKHNPIPKHEINWSVFSQIQKLTNKRLRVLLSQHESPDSPRAVIKAQRVYKSCMNTRRRNNKGIKPLETILNKNGGWPIAMLKESWNSDGQSWFDLDEFYFRLTGELAIMNINYVPDDDDSSKIVIAVDQARTFPFLEQSKNLAVKASREKYFEIIRQTAEIFAVTSGNVPPKQILDDVENIILFEHQLQNVTQLDVDSNPEKMTIGEFQAIYDNFGNFTQPNEFQVNWLSMVRRIFKDVTSVKIKKNTKIYVYCSICMYNMARIVGDTDKRIIVNYIHWVFISNHMQFANKQLRDIRFKMIHSNYKDVARKPRWEQCINDLPLRDGMGLLYTQRYVGPEIINIAIDMTDRIRDELKKDVEQIKWANDSTKQYIIDKLNHLHKEIGYPAWYTNKTVVTKLYENTLRKCPTLHGFCGVSLEVPLIFDCQDLVTIGPDYLKNVLSYTAHDIAGQLQFLATGLPQHEWFDYPITVNAFYYDSDNTIILPAAQLQDPYFLEEMPNALKYGFVGFIVGHEIGHGLDVQGVHYDKDGNRGVNDVQEFIDNHRKRAKCFVDQFGKYKLHVLNGKPIYLSGKLTRDENIADSLGIQVAYDAFKLKQQYDTTTFATLKKLPNIDADQLFFLSFATGWCYDERTGINRMVHTDVHSPPKIRVNGALSNSKEFSKAFQCRSASKMNPVKKCSLWK